MAFNITNDVKRHFSFLIFYIRKLFKGKRGVKLIFSRKYRR